MRKVLLLSILTTLILYPLSQALFSQRIIDQSWAAELEITGEELSDGHIVVSGFDVFRIYRSPQHYFFSNWDKLLTCFAVAFVSSAATFVLVKRENS